MSPAHLKRGEHSHYTVCGEGDVATAELAVWGRTYGTEACLDCGETWRKEQSEGGVNVALLDCQRLDSARAA